MDIFFDTHAHLDFPDFDRDRKEMIARARQAGVRYIMTIGSGRGLESAGAALAIAESDPEIWATVGVHPHDVRLMKDEDLALLRDLAGREKVAAIGEIGLDYAKERSPRELQQKRFRDQLGLAHELELPVVIHDREAHEDLVKLLKRDGAPAAGGVMHCFSGTADLARELIAMGFFISFPGVITFKNARGAVETVRAVPLEKMLIETDCPFLAPAPHRGKRNEPAHVKLVAAAVARILNRPLAEVADQTTRNAFSLFRLPSP